jgi:hypothetical protein
MCYRDYHKEILAQWRLDQDVECLPNQKADNAIHFQVGLINGIPCVQNIRSVDFSSHRISGEVFLLAGRILRA